MSACGLRVAGTGVSLGVVGWSRLRLVAAALACATVLASQGRAADGPPGRIIRYASDKLTVELSQMALGDVLQEVGRQAGADIQGGLRTPRDVSAQFEDVPLPEALHRLLGEQNFALVYGEGGRLRTVKLLGGPLGPPPTVSFATTASPSTTVPGKAADGAAALLNIVVTHPPVPVTGRLATALGAETATVQQIVEAGLHNDDAGVRSEGIRRTLSLIEAEPDLRSALLGAMKTMDDGDLAGMMRNASPTHAEEIAVHIATQSRVSELRIKASGVLQQLRTPKAGG